MFMRKILPYFLFIIHKNNKLRVVYFSWLSRTTLVQESTIDAIGVFCEYCLMLRKMYRYARGFAAESLKRRCVYTTLEEEFILDYCYYL
jgi:hypothetical protein